MSITPYIDPIIDVNYGSYLPIDRQARILDLGCGTGRMLTYLENKGYSNFIGIDIDSESLVQVPENLRNRTLCVTDLSKYLSENRGMFALIVVKDVLYYFNKNEACHRMNEIASALEDGGIIIAEVFNGATLSATYTAAKDIGIKMVFTEQSLFNILRGSGLEVIKVFGQLEERNYGLRRMLYKLAVSVWHKVLQLIYLLERGMDTNNPRIFNKSLLAVAKKPAR